MIPKIMTVRTMSFQVKFVMNSCHVGMQNPYYNASYLSSVIKALRLNKLVITICYNYAKLCRITLVRHAEAVDRRRVTVLEMQIDEYDVHVGDDRYERRCDEK